MTIYLVCERGFTSPVSSNIFKYRLTVRSDTLCSWPISCGEACQARAIQIIRHRKSREYGIGMTKARRRCFCCLDLPRHIIWVKVQAIVRMRIRYWTTNLKIPVALTTRGEPTKCACACTMQNEGVARDYHRLVDKHFNR